MLRPKNGWSMSRALQAALVLSLPLGLGCTDGGPTPPEAEPCDDCFIRASVEGTPWVGVTGTVLTGPPAVLLNAAGSTLDGTQLAPRVDLKVVLLQIPVESGQVDATGLVAEWENEIAVVFQSEIFEVTVDTLDLQRGLMSGSFSFDARQVGASGVIRRVRDGSFRLPIVDLRGLPE